jgi:hypothetical protein
VLGVIENFLHDSVSLRAVAIKSNKFVRNDRTVQGRTGTDGDEVDKYIRSDLRYMIIHQSPEVEVKFLFVKISLLNRVVLVGSVYYTA